MTYNEERSYVTPLTPDPQLTSIQSDLVALLHEIGGVIEEERLRPRGRRSLPQGRFYVGLTMTGDNLRRVRVLVGPFGAVEWEVIGQ